MILILMVLCYVLFVRFLAGGTVPSTLYHIKRLNQQQHTYQTFQQLVDAVRDAVTQTQDDKQRILAYITGGAGHTNILSGIKNTSTTDLDKIYIAAGGHEQ